ncbi:mitochondrial antiviral-signaling protein-like [Dendropsophus ebraccatus]|uniref:mitochondrial antiviral-signaling protein-like n=1 Tax=Dendropsophus ebraccatus TaxID=150705 RepID=UPI003832224E
MGFAEDKFLQYLRKNLTLLEPIKVDELLGPLSGCLSMATVEKLNTYVRNQGNRKTVMDFYLDLSRSDNWVSHFIDALEHCEHKELAERFKKVYSSFQLPKFPQSSPSSLPPSINHHNRQTPQKNPEHYYISLPGQTSPIKIAMAQGPAIPFQRPKQVQPEQQMAHSSPSHPSHGFGSLSPLPQDPPAPPRTPISHNASAPIQSDRKTSEDDARNPVPETTPCQAAPSGRDGEKESSIPEVPNSVPDPLPRGCSSPNLKGPHQEVSIRTSPEEGSPAKLPEPDTTPSYSPSTSSDRGADNWRSQREPDKNQLPEKDPAYMTVNSGQKVQPPAIRNAAIRPDQPGSALDTRSVRPKVVGGVQHNGQSAYQAVENVPDRSAAKSRPVNRRSAQEEPNREWPLNQWVDRSPAMNRPVIQDTAQQEPNREWPPNQQVDNVPDRNPATNRSVIQDTPQQEPHREWSPNPQVSSGSSCRPLGNTNDDEEYNLGKPGVLMSTPESAYAPNLGALSEMSHISELQISDCTEADKSSNAGGRSSSSSTEDPPPPVDTSNNRSLPIRNRRSPEENDFMFDSRSSPGRNRQLSDPSSTQAEENTFDSRDVNHFRLQYNERPEENLMDINDSLRNRPRKSPNTSESNDQNRQQEYSKKTEGRDYERKVLVTITVASLCLSLYLLWKSRNN